MSLARKIDLVSVSTDGTTITVKETTGAYSGSNPGGYGTPNPATSDVLFILFDLNYFNGDTSRISIGTSTGLPAYLAGGNLALSGLLVPDIASAVPFKDGVVTIKSWAVMTIQSASAIVGNNYITGTGLTPIITAGYMIIIGQQDIYKVDTSKPNSPTQVWFTSSIAYPSASVSPVYLATTYALVTVEFNCKLVNAIAGMAQQCSDLYDSSSLSDLLVKKFSADFEFAAKDYSGADFTIHSAILRLNRMING